MVVGVGELEIGVGDGGGAFVFGFEHGAEGVVAGGVEVVGVLFGGGLFADVAPAFVVGEVVVGGDDVGAEEDASFEGAEELCEAFGGVFGELADHPFGGGGVEDDVGEFVEEVGEEVEVFGPAAHVCDEPGDVELGGECAEVVVLGVFGAEELGVGVLGLEPGVGVGEVCHEHVAE